MRSNRQIAEDIVALVVDGLLTSAKNGVTTEITKEVLVQLVVRQLEKAERERLAFTNN